MSNILYVLIVICSHGPDNKQLLVDAFPFETIQKCEITESSVKKNMAECNQLATSCQKKEIIK